MPVGIDELFKQLNLSPQGPYSWGDVENVSKMPGVYVVALKNILSNAPIDIEQIRLWCERCPNMLVDGMTATVDRLVEKISSCWVAEESIVYIGKTDRSLANRLNEFDIHTLGNSSPHRGGHWLKVLESNIEKKVYVASCDHPEVIEEKMLTIFYNFYEVYPFANLTGPHGRRRHGIKHQTRR